MNMSGMFESIADRLNSLEYQLSTNKSRFLGSILDLENEISKLAILKPLKLPNSIEIEEFADENGYLNDPNIPEATWLETLSRETDLDCRMIVDFKPVRELGMERWQVVVNQEGKPVTYDISVWIIPVLEKKS